MTSPDDTPDEFAELSDEAKADAAPVAPDLDYRPRKAWRPGDCLGFIVNTTSPVAKLKWPKGRSKREFLERLFQSLEKMPPCPRADQSRAEQEQEHDS